MEAGILDIYTVSFFGHRRIENAFGLERRLENIVAELIGRREYIVFLVGRGGEFDQYAASAVRRCRRSIRSDNSSLVLVLPYMNAEYRKNMQAFHDYYDEIEICESSSRTHAKRAHLERNRHVVDRSDLIIFYVDHDQSGAYLAMKYALKTGRNCINLA